MDTFTFIAAGVPASAESWTRHIMPSASFLDFFTNSIFVAVLVMVVVCFLGRRATRRMELIPSGRQNRFEAIVEALYDMFEGIVGKHMAPKTFSLLASLFIYILACNWCGILPFVGTMGWGHPVAGIFPFNVPHVEVPLLRPVTSDFNATFGLTILFMVFWLVWSIREVGFGGFLKHIFGMKGEFTGIMFVLMAFIFFFAGIIEMVSIFFARPVSLAMRLFG
ncbi:MAG: F0F1 ATP synthase subunit A, partial [Chthoniobacterales bacterium]